MDQNKIKAALVRALRTYLVVAVPAILAVLNSSGPLDDVSAWKVALYSGVPAALSFLWRTLLDPSPIPSLKDADQPAS